SAAVLIGLMFVSITLISDARPRGSSQEVGAAIGAFSTPTVVHFCAVLLVCALLSAPWQALSIPGLILGLSGVAGVAYAAIVALRMRRNAIYRPDAEDWLCYAALPIVAYAALAVAAVLLARGPAPTLFGIGAVVLLLLFLGIRNAWDIVTFVALQRLQAPNGGQE